MFMSTLNRFILLSFILALFSGCATVDTRVVLLYEPSGTAKGGSGDIYLAPQSVSPVSGDSNSVQWILGGISNKDGERVASVVSTRSPSDLIIDAFTQELKSGGFRAIQVVKTLPADVDKGLRIVDAKIKLDEVRNIINVEATCSVQLTVEAWRKGKIVKTLKYDAEITNSKVNDRDRIVSNTLQRTLQKVMIKSMPEIIRTIE